MLSIKWQIESVQTCISIRYWAVKGIMEKNSQDLSPMIKSDVVVQRVFWLYTDLPWLKGVCCSPGFSRFWDSFNCCKLCFTSLLECRWCRIFLVLFTKYNVFCTLKKVVSFIVIQWTMTTDLKKDVFVPKRSTSQQSSWFVSPLSGTLSSFSAYSTFLRAAL